MCAYVHMFVRVCVLKLLVYVFTERLSITFTIRIFRFNDMYFDETKMRDESSPVASTLFKVYAIKEGRTVCTYESCLVLLRELHYIHIIPRGTRTLGVIINVHVLYSM